MNVIQCMRCGDLLAPCMTPTVFRKKCACGEVEIQIIDPDAELYKDHRVEVMLSRVAIGARVIKINSGFLFGKGRVYAENLLDFDGMYLKGTLFAEQRSHIVIAPLDTPGVKVVKGFTAACAIK